MEGGLRHLVPPLTVRAAGSEDTGVYDCTLGIPMALAATKEGISKALLGKRAGSNFMSCQQSVAAGYVLQD